VINPDRDLQPIGIYLIADMWSQVRRDAGADALGRRVAGADA
jgi:hypothetical protein